MTVLTTIPNGASYRDIRDTLNSVLARISVLEGTPAPTPPPTPSPTPAPTPTPPPPPSNATLTNTTLTIGDSWYAEGQPPYAGFYMGGYFAGNSAHTVLNFAKGGQGFDYIRSRVNDIIAARPYVVVISTGRNDFMNNNSGAGIPDAQFYTTQTAQYRSIIDDLKAALPGVAIAVETITERHSGAPDNAFEAAFNGRRKDLNALIRQWKVDGVIAQVIDIGGDPVLGADGAMQRGSAMTSDGLHLREAPAGHGAAAPIFASAMNALYAATPEPTEDFMSSFSIAAPAAANEGNSGTTAFLFPVTRSGALSRTASVDWSVTGSGANPATASDFVDGALPNGTLAFAAGEASKTITVYVQGDAAFEQDEAFTVALSNPQVTGALTTATAASAITNDDAQPAAVGYVLGTQAAQSPGLGGKTADFINQSLAVGKLVVHVWSDYGRTPNSVTLKRSGQADIALSKLGTDGDNGLWVCDVPAAAGNYTIALARTSDGLINQMITPIVVTGAAAAHTQHVEQNFISGGSSPVTMTNTLTKPVNGLSLKFFWSRTNAGSPTHADNDGGTQVATLTSPNYDGGTVRVTVSTLPSTVKPSSGFTPAGSVTNFQAIAFAKA